MEYIKKNSGLIFIFLISLLPILNLTNSGLFTSHDGLDHVYRAANFYKSLSDGVIIPRWAGNLNWGYGHPVLMFLYPLPSYVMAFFHFIDISYVNSLKLLFAVSYSLSGIFMYLWLSKLLGKYSAIIGATLYLFAPYRFVDIYVRGAIGEHVAFVFLPLVLLAIYLVFNQSQNKIRYYYLNFIFVSLSFAFLILSHNAISLLFIPFIIFYTFYLYFETRSKKNLVLSIFYLLYGFAISFFFWFPAFFEGKYTLRDIVTQNVYSQRFVEFKELIYGNWSFGGTGEFTTQLGLIGIIICISSIALLFKLRKTKDNHKYLLLGTVIFLSISIFLMLPQSNFIWENIKILQKLQFPWRFLSITTFCISLIGAIVFEKLQIKSKTLITAIFVFLIIFPTISYWQAKEYKKYNDEYFEKIAPTTTDTGESSPIWSIRSMDGFYKNNLEIIEGDAQIVNYLRKSNYHEYLVDVKEKTRFRENTLYFPGWKIYDNYNLMNNVEFQDLNNQGVLTFYLDEGLHDVILKFENTKVRFYSNTISLISIILIIILPIIFILFPNIKIKKYKW